MPVWPYRYQLGLKSRVRRSVYEVLRDQMDDQLIKHALVDSYARFKAAGEPYPFVPKRELKPRAKVIAKEYSHQNHFLVIFCEGTIPGKYKKHIRFFDSNRVTKESVNDQLVQVQLHKNYARNLRHFDNPDFGRFLIDLTPVDYAILVQHDPSVRSLNRYVMTHFHVRIDWPIDDATEDMAHSLRYISKDLYENGEKYAQSLHHKLFEHYGFHHAIGGRRTAAVVASQFLKQMNFISTVYVASSENRALTRLSERGVTKYILVRIPEADMEMLARQADISQERFQEFFTIAADGNSGVGILQVVYRNSIFSNPPDDGKLRKLRPDYQWLTVCDQLLFPVRQTDIHPVPYSTIYTSD